MKFGNLLKKELSELFTKQAIISMVFTMAILIFMGQFVGTAMEETFNTSTINISNMDNTEFTKTVLNKIEEDESLTINYVDITSEDYAAELERLDIKNLVIIPEGYADSILVEKKPAMIKFVSALNLGGFMSSLDGVASSEMIGHIENASTNEILLQEYGISYEDIERIKSPATSVEYTTNNGKTAQIASSSMTGMLMMQSFIAPMVIFILLLMAAQMIMTAISTEKIDKTLETLLSTPVSRMSVLGAKMVAAVLAALANAGFMMIGFIFYMQGMLGSAMDQINTAVDTAGLAEIAGEMNVSSLGDAMVTLGVTLSPLSYVLFGLQLFFTIAIGLSAALILGAMATDIKSIQTLIMPIMIAVMLPWVVTMFTDVNSLPALFRTVLYLIPFTHTYMALNNLMNGEMLIFWAGFVYQIIFLLVCMYLAIKIFTTDKLFTMSFNIGKKNQNRKTLAKKA